MGHQGTPQDRSGGLSLADPALHRPRNAEILYVLADRVLEVAQREGARSFDAPSAEFTHRDGLCTFEVLIEEFGLAGDPALWFHQVG